MLVDLFLFPSLSLIEVFSYNKSNINSFYTCVLLTSIRFNDLDFAFSIHTEVGYKTRGAKVNGKLVPLSHTLKSGDQIEVITSSTNKPNSRWLDFVITARAKSKIRAALKDEEKKIEDILVNQGLVDASIY